MSKLAFYAAVIDFPAREREPLLIVGGEWLDAARRVVDVLRPFTPPDAPDFWERDGRAGGTVGMSPQEISDLLWRFRHEARSPRVTWYTPDLDVVVSGRWSS